MDESMDIHVWISDLGCTRPMDVSVDISSGRLFSFYRAMLRRARYCYGKLSVCPSVCPSVRNVEVL